MFELTARQIEQFREDGLLIVENVLSDEDVDALRARYECLFRGEFETGGRPLFGLPSGQCLSPLVQTRAPVQPVDVDG